MPKPSKYLAKLPIKKGTAKSPMKHLNPVFGHRFRNFQIVNERLSIQSSPRGRSSNSKQFWFDRIKESSSVDQFATGQRRPANARMIDIDPAKKIYGFLGGFLVECQYAHSIHDAIQMLRQGQIIVNGKVQKKADYKLKSDDVVQLKPGSNSKYLGQIKVLETILHLHETAGKFKISDNEPITNIENEEHAKSITDYNLTADKKMNKKMKQGGEKV